MIFLKIIYLKFRSELLPLLLSAKEYEKWKGYRSFWNLWAMIFGITTRTVKAKTHADLLLFPLLFLLQKSLQSLLEGIQTIVVEGRGCIFIVRERLLSWPGIGEEAVALKWKKRSGLKEERNEGDWDMFHRGIKSDGKRREMISLSSLWAHLRIIFRIGRVTGRFVFRWNRADLSSRWGQLENFLKIKY